MSKEEIVKETKSMDIDKSPETPFLVDLFKAFNESAINYCVLRNYAGLPYDLMGSDLDILLKEESLGYATTLILNLAVIHKGRAVWRNWNDCLRMILCWGTCSKCGKWGVHIDAFTALRWKGLDYYSRDDVLSRAIDYRGVQVTNLYDMRMISFLKEVLHTKSNRKGYSSLAIAAYKQSSDKERAELAATFGKKAKYLVKFLKDMELHNISNLARKVRGSLLVHQFMKSPLKVIRNKFIRNLIHVQRILKRPGIFVVVMGLDGSGKSTLIRLARHDIECLIQKKTEYRHFHPNLLPSLSKLAGRRNMQIGPVRNPHSKVPSGIVGSLARVAYYTLDFVIGYWVLIYPLLVKSPTIFFFDRYFYDYLIDPIRYRINVPRWLIGIFEKVIPQADLIIMLKPDLQTFYIRKPELPLNELNCQSGRMYEFAKKYKNAVWIDSSGKIEAAKCEMIKEILRKYGTESGWHEIGISK
jgi:hypothetical protein